AGVARGAEVVEREVPLDGGEAIGVPGRHGDRAELGPRTVRAVARVLEERALLDQEVCTDAVDGLAAAEHPVPIDVDPALAPAALVGEAVGDRGRAVAGVEPAEVRRGRSG